MTTYVRFLILLFLFAGCTTADQAVNNSQADTGQTPDQTLQTASGLSLPAWFAEDTLGEANGGKLYGYAAAPGVDRERAIRIADQQAARHLRYWVDFQLEESRKTVVEEEVLADSPEFISELRNAVREMEFPGATYRNESAEKNGVILGFSRIEVDTEELLESIGSRLQSYDTVWNRILNTDIAASDS